MTRKYQEFLPVFCNAHAYAKMLLKDAYFSHMRGGFNHIYERAHIDLPKHFSIDNERDYECMMELVHYFVKKEIDRHLANEYADLPKWGSTE